jgi:hypothetical protein
MPTYIVETTARVNRSYRVKAKDAKTAIESVMDGDEDPRDETDEGEDVVDVFEVADDGTITTIDIPA